MFSSNIISKQNFVSVGELWAGRSSTYLAPYQPPSITMQRPLIYSKPKCIPFRRKPKTRREGPTRQTSSCFSSKPSPRSNFAINFPVEMHLAAETGEGASGCQKVEINRKQHPIGHSSRIAFGARTSHPRARGVVIDGHQLLLVRPPSKRRITS